ncbi:MAG: hypothetical protein MZU95_04475 [Desulfomicrobium escambiense]|nr:hypothetical protein [Desulfomicrobium escambiense]
MEIQQSSISFTSIKPLNRIVKGIENPNSKISGFIDKPNVQNAINLLDEPQGLLPVILLETAVTSGRSYQGAKRGGWIEFRERFVEESMAALIWLFGVKALQKAFDFALHKGFKYNTKFDHVTDKLAQSSDNFMNMLKTPLENFTKGRNAKFTNKLAALKLAKDVVSV